MKKPFRPHTPNPKPSKPRTDWHNVADWYDALVGDDGSEYHQQVIFPNLLRLMGLSAQIDNRKSKIENASPPRVIDLACGQGAFCRALSDAGAQSVLGIDAAPALITAARQRTAAANITYMVADATQLLKSPDPTITRSHHSFDAITLILAIQNMTPLSPIWQACHALLKPNAHLYLVMMHPCFRIPKQSGWHWDDATQTQSRLITQYLTSSKTDIQMKPGKASSGGPGQTTTTFHRPLQAYANTLASHHLLIDHIDEWASHKISQAGPKKAALDRSRKEIPMFLGLRCRAVAP